jgi:hypothetical protein
MPITPFHFGPGAALHSIAPKHISFLTFCSANILIDLEPLYYLLHSQYPLHRFFHTYIGATIITSITAVIFLSAVKLATKIKLPNIFQWQQLTPLPIWLGAATGSYSHIIFDSVMHADIRPLAPFSEANVLYQILPLSDLHLFCVLAAIVGLLITGIRRLM